MTTYQRRRRRVLALLGAGIGTGAGVESVGAIAQQADSGQTDGSPRTDPPVLRIAWQETQNGVDVDAHPASDEAGKRATIRSREEIEAAVPALDATGVEAAFRAQFTDSVDAFGCDGRGPVVDLSDAHPGSEGSVQFDLLVTGGPGVAVMRARPCADAASAEEAGSSPVAIDARVIPISTDFGLARPIPGQFPMDDHAATGEASPIFDAVRARVVRVGGAAEEDTAETVVVEGTLGAVLATIDAGSVRIGGESSAEGAPATAGTCLSAGSRRVVRFDWAVPTTETVTDRTTEPVRIALGFEVAACEST
ncbi:hypothetical protein [Haloarchaeobius sp. DT45]|uniref:hypothetical protein n=1 Tax=Haloarchaeobius sp. DT45 TaxID=3446116 RepID=UPI003F6D521B